MRKSKRRKENADHLTWQDSEKFDSYWEREILGSFFVAQERCFSGSRYLQMHMVQACLSPNMKQR